MWPIRIGSLFLSSLFFICCVVVSHVREKSDQSSSVSTSLESLAAQCGARGVVSIIKSVKIIIKSVFLLIIYNQKCFCVLFSFLFLLYYFISLLLL